MTTITPDLLPNAADIIKDKGWIQGAEETPEGVCLTGAVKLCAPQPGDFHIAQQVLDPIIRVEPGLVDAGVAFVLAPADELIQVIE